MVRALVPRLVAALIAVAGLVLLVLGISRGSSFADPAPVGGRLSRPTQPLLVTAPGMTELTGATLRVRAVAPDGTRPVFIGVGRADDVEAYLGTASRTEVTALAADGSLRVAERAGDGKVTDPATADVWAAAVRTAGAATLTWPRTPGAWRMVVSTDGTVPPASVEFTWSGSTGSSPAPALIAVGAVVLIAGVVAFLAIRAGRIFGGSGSPDEVARRRAREQRAARVAARATAAAEAAAEPPAEVEAQVETSLPDSARADEAATESATAEPVAVEPATEEPVAVEPGSAEPAAADSVAVADRPLMSRREARRLAAERAETGRAVETARADAGDQDGELDDVDEPPVVVRPFRRRGSGGVTP